MFGGNARFGFPIIVIIPAKQKRKINQYEWSICSLHQPIIFVRIWKIFSLPVVPIPTMMIFHRSWIIQIAIVCWMYEVLIIVVTFDHNHMCIIKRVRWRHGLWCRRIIEWFICRMVYLLLLLLRMPPRRHRSPLVNVCLFEKNRKAKDKRKEESFTFSLSPRRSSQYISLFFSLSLSPSYFFIWEIHSMYREKKERCEHKGNATK